MAMRYLFFLIALLIGSLAAFAQSSSEPNQAPPSSRRSSKQSPIQSQDQKPPRSDSGNQQADPSSPDEQKTPGDEANAPPKTPAESSSRENIGDLTPPKDD